MCQLAVWDLMILVIGVRLTDDSELHTHVNVSANGCRSICGSSVIDW